MILSLLAVFILLKSRNTVAAGKNKIHTIIKINSFFLLLHDSENTKTVTLKLVSRLKYLDNFHFVHNS